MAFSFGGTFLPDCLQRKMGKNDTYGEKYLSSVFKVTFRDTAYHMS